MSLAERPTVQLIAGVLGWRPPRSTVTPRELDLLLRFARGAGELVEVGVFEGVTSRALVKVLEPGHRLTLVDPYFQELRVERWLRFSGTRKIARKALRGQEEHVRWMERTSVEAAREFGPSTIGMVFLDARHDYASVCEDLRLWSELVRPEGAIAVHDCRPCAGRPELRRGEGSCRAMEEFVAAGEWELFAEADSLAVLRRRGAPSGRSTGSH